MTNCTRFQLHVERMQGDCSRLVAKIAALAQVTATQSDLSDDMMLGSRSKRNLATAVRDSIQHIHLHTYNLFLVFNIACRNKLA